MTRSSKMLASLAGTIALLLPLAAARADIVLSELIVELQPGKHGREDIEVWNKDSIRAYVEIDPAEILDPGRAGQSRRIEPDPEKLGLLVAPARMILEPGQRKLVRVAAIGPDAGRERVYRVTVKPVAGRLESTSSGLKVLVGYDVLVLVRPAAARPNLSGERAGNLLKLHNGGNVSLELTGGRQCDSQGQHCADLPGKRLYAGADWAQTLPGSGPVDYSVRSPVGVTGARF